MSLVFSRTSFAEDDLASKFEFLIREMLSARQDARSGAADITGTSRASGAGGGKLEGSVMGSFRFQAETNSYLLQWEEPCNLILQAPSNHTLPDSGESGTQYNVRKWFCRNPEYFAEFRDIPDSSPRSITSLAVRTTDYDDRKKSASCGSRPFDPFAAAMSGYFEFLKGKEATDVYEEMLAKTVESYNIDNSIVTVGLKDDNASYVLVVDREMMVPLKLTQKSLSDPSEFTNEAQWRIVNGVAVPVKFTAKLNYPEVADEIHDYSLNWSRVNEKFEKSEFEYTAFTNIPPDIVSVIDFRGDEHKDIGRWYAGGIIEMPIDHLRRQQNQVLQAKPHKNNYWILIGVNLLLLIFLLVWAIVRHKRKKV